MHRNHDGFEWKMILPFLCVLVAIFAAFSTQYEQALEAHAKAAPTTLQEQLQHLPASIRAWGLRGSFLNVFTHDVFVVDIPFVGSVQSDTPTFLILHGFPTSSFDYANVVDKLAQRGRVVLHDHLGFGLSEKPIEVSADTLSKPGAKEVFTYSISDHADVAVAIYLQKNVKNVVLIGHDMGDSIVTEILARRDRAMLTFQFSQELRAVMFTNGGMSIARTNLRISQIALKSPLGAFFNRLILFVDPWNAFTRSQLRGIFAPTEQGPLQHTDDGYHRNGLRNDSTDDTKNEQLVEAIIALNEHKGGHALFHRTIRYIHDRYEYEGKWLASLKRLDIPCVLLWGTEDAVAPLNIAQAVHHIARQCVLQRVYRTGHFVVNENEKAWMTTIDEILKIVTPVLTM